MQSPYLSGPYAPVDREIDATLEVVAGEVPRDVVGTYVRNGPNPRHQAPGMHHWFDGDGMLHAARIEDGVIRYRNRWVRTPAFEAEAEAGRALWKGLMESTRENPAGAPYKDTGNTDVIAHDGELLTLHYIGGQPHRVDPVTLASRGPHHFGGERPHRMSAHSKVDPRTGELLFFDYGPRPPFMTFGAVKDGVITHRTAIDLPGPRLPHDMAVTDEHVVLMDLPVHFRAEALKRKKWMVEFHRDVPARFGVLQRGDDGGTIRWFEAEPCYVYHVVNAWEEDGAIVMVGCRCDDPIPAVDPDDGPYARAMSTLRLRAHLYRWRFDLGTGATTEGPLDDVNAEFPSVAAGAVGRRSRFSYHMTIPDTRTLFFDGIVKYDLEGTSERHTFGEHIYGSEAPFAARDGATDEDDGYLFTFVTDAREDASELWIYDAREVARGPICRAKVPQRVPLGFHAAFAPDAGAAS